MLRGSNKAIFPSQAKNKYQAMSADLIDDILDQEIDWHEDHCGTDDMTPEFESGFVAGLKMAKKSLNAALQKINE